MPATPTPLPVSPESLEAQFVGFYPALTAVAQKAYPAEDEDNAVRLLLEKAARAAQHKLQELTGIPYFLTRYATRELAAQGTSRTGVLPIAALTAIPQTLADGWFTPALPFEPGIVGEVTPNSQIPTYPPTLTAWSVPASPGGSISGSVEIEGFDGDGAAVSDTLALGAAGGYTTTGRYARITAITLPARTSAGDAVSIGQTVGLTPGGDFDEYVLPLNYRRDVFLKQTGRTTLRWHPVREIGQYTLTLENGAQVAAIDRAWLQLNHEKGVVHVLPSGLASAGLNFQSLYGVSVFARGAATGQVPLLIHARYRAGLVERTGSYDDPLNASLPYDPDAYPKNSWWRQELAEAYQTYLIRLVAALLYPPCAAWLARGGVQIAVPGISESVNPQSLFAQAESYQKEAEAWANEVSTQTRGLVMAML